MQTIVNYMYLVSASLFILSLAGLSSAKSAARGNYFGMAGMGLVILSTMVLVENHLLIFITISIGAVIGILIAKKIVMTALPQLIAAFHSLIGLAAVLIGYAVLFAPASFGVGLLSNIGKASLIELAIGGVIGGVTFTGSVIAFLKLSGILKRNLFTVTMPMIVAFKVATILFLIIFVLSGSPFLYTLVILLSFLGGIILVMPVGGADMPVIVSLLNSYSGFAACGIGFTLCNNMLIIVGALVGSSGAILSFIMCKAMNRSIFNVLLGGLNKAEDQKDNTKEKSAIKKTTAEDTAFLMANAGKVIIVPGYGMAVAGAQHSICKLYDSLCKKGIEVKFAIHPVAGRMPGHMNVLLAEADIDYESVFELEDINDEFKTTDVVYVVGANDITNPAALNDTSSPIYGMPILNVSDARSVVFVKRSMSYGYAGIDNDLFYSDNTMMLLCDAKKATDDIVKAIEEY